MIDDDKQRKRRAHRAEESLNEVLTRVAKQHEEYAVDDETARKQREEEEAREKQHHAYRLGVMGVPSEHRDAIMGTLFATKVIGVTRGWWDNEAIRSHKPVVVLAGGTGSGKTLAACDLISRALRVGKGARFVASGELSRTSRYSKRDVDALREVYLLVIDDLGVEYNDGKGAFQSLLDELLSSRIANNKPTVITTNLQLRGGAFRTRYGDRIASRLARGYAYETNEEDLRRRKEDD